jgi:hypothetical protein
VSVHIFNPHHHGVRILAIEYRPFNEDHRTVANVQLGRQRLDRVSGEQIDKLFCLRRPLILRNERSSALRGDDGGFYEGFRHQAVG